MKTLKEFERKRIMNMIKDDTLCICPDCKKEVYPRYIRYMLGLTFRSNLYWCPKCLKGKAGIFWREV